MKGGPMVWLTTLKTEQLERTSFKLIEDLKYGELTVPRGFITNYASIKVLHNILLFPLYALVSGYGNYASTLHDYLYKIKLYDRKTCDLIFYKALRDEGVAKWRAAIMWAGVRIGGKKSYGG